MSKTIELIFDFVSPNAYMIWQPLKDLAATHGATIAITPAYLGGMHKLTGNAPPFVRDAEVKGKNEYAMIEMNRFIAKHRLTKFQMNPKFPFNTITLLRMLVALEPDQRAPFIELLLPPIWEQQMDVTDSETLGKILQDGGLDAQGLFAPNPGSGGPTGFDGQYRPGGRARCLWYSDDVCRWRNLFRQRAAWSD